MEKQIKSNENSILVNLSWIGFANLVAKPIWFLFLVFTARMLGAEDFGRFTFSVSFVMIFAILYELGIDLFTVKEVAIDKQSSNKLLGNSLILKVFLAPFISGFVIIIIHILGYSGITLYSVYWAIIYVFFTTTTNYLRTFFRGFEKINLEAYSIIVEKFILCFLGGFALISRVSVVDFLKILTLGSFISLICTAVILFKKLVIPDFSFNLKYVFEILKKAWPFALMNIFILIYFRIDAVMLSIMKNETAVGLYSSGYRIMEMLLMIPAVIMVPIYPAMARLSHDDNLKFRELSQITAKAMILLSIPITLVVFFLAHDFMLLFYSRSEYLLATPALKILSCVLPFNSLTCVFATMIAAKNRQILTTRNTAICASLNIILNLFLIPKYSFVGASIATLITEGLLTVLSYSAIVNYFTAKVFKEFMKKFSLLILLTTFTNIILRTNNFSIYLSTILTMLLFIIGTFIFGLIEMRILKLLSPRVIITRIAGKNMS